MKIFNFLQQFLLLFVSQGQYQTHRWRETQFGRSAIKTKIILTNLSNLNTLVMNYGKPQLHEFLSLSLSNLSLGLLSRRGLSRYYAGKSRSFKRMADVQCVEDLEKEERPTKKRKKHAPLLCRVVSSSTQCAPPIFGV